MQRRGLPEDYRLSLSEEDFADKEPAEVGDFFDEDVSVPAQESSDQPKVIPIREANPASPSVTADDIPKSTPPQSRNSLRRRQINMTPEVDQMVDELLHDVSTYSGEKNPTAADLIHVLVTIAHGARQEFSFSKVPSRGRWGSPTVKVFHDSLMAVVTRAPDYGWGVGDALCAAERACRSHEERRSNSVGNRVELAWHASLTGKEQHVLHQQDSCHDRCSIGGDSIRLRVRVGRTSRQGKSHAARGR